MGRNETFKDDYFAFMSDIINGGFVERAREEAPVGAVNYIPHHGVYHSKKNKLRIVFDCSARFGGTCLNDHLLKGPDLTNALSGDLMRFQKHEVAMLCDIEKMFFQFRVEKCDRNFLRFLWWEGNDIQRAPVDYRMTVNLFGAASSPGCANYGLKYLANQHMKNWPEKQESSVTKVVFVFTNLSRMIRQ
ncbi:uncharacterized protein [Diadema setosum]|uniref:uncharacterized protein n=1 Tax=Diadema setosum TaxID=31175 RepID=UPI003B3BA1FE